MIDKCHPFYFIPEIQLESGKLGHMSSTGVAAESFMCQYCDDTCKKYGFTKGGKQRFQCRSCKRISLAYYKAALFSPDLNKQIILLLKEGCSVRSISRIVRVAASTVIRRIKKIGSFLEPPAISPGQAFELDELCTYVGKKSDQIWIAYAIRKDTRAVVDFTIGNRSNKTLSRITDRLLLSAATKIYTDKLIQYKSLIPSSIHVTKKYCINHSERKNLTLRTHLKR